MIKLRVSSNLRGTLVVSTYGKAPLIANRIIEVSEDQYWRDDIQKALKKKFLIQIEGEIEMKETVEIIKNVKGSLILPIINRVLRDEPLKISSDLLKKPEFVQLREEKKILVLTKKMKADVKASDSENKAVVWDPRKKAEQENPEPPKRKRGRPRIHKVGKSPDEVAENGKEPGDEDGIKWVDVEQTEERIKNHPILGKQTKVRHDMDRNSESED